MIWKIAFLVSVILNLWLMYRGRSLEAFIAMLQDQLAQTEFALTRKTKRLAELLEEKV